MSTRTTSFAGQTTAEILAAVTADASAQGEATRELAIRTLRTKPRKPAVDGFAVLTDGLTYADAGASGSPAAYKAWVAATQAAAREFLGEAKPKASSKAKAPAKAPAKRKATRKAAAKPKASTGGVDKAAVAQAMGVSEDALDAVAKFFATLG